MAERRWDPEEERRRWFLETGSCIALFIRAAQSIPKRRIVAPILVMGKPRHKEGDNLLAQQASVRAPYGTSTSEFHAGALAKVSPLVVREHWDGEQGSC